MIIILFRSRLTAAAGEDYAQLDRELSERVRTYSGFIDAKSFKAEDGERLTVVWWKDHQSLQEWSTDERHRFAKQTGRRDWYEYYKIEVADVVRVSHFERTPSQSS